MGITGSQGLRSPVAGGFKFFMIAIKKKGENHEAKNTVQTNTEDPGDKDPDRFPFRLPGGTGEFS